MSTGAAGRNVAWKRAVIALAALAMWQALSFYVFAKQTLRRELPAMARAELELRHSDDPTGNTGGGRPIFKDYVIKNADAGALGADVARELAGTFRDFGLTLQVEGKLRPPRSLAGYDCGGCYLYVYDVATRTPFYGAVLTFHRGFGGVGVSYEHRRLWVLGVWLTLSDEFSGIS